ncbi:MAG: hypothetical protein HC826_01550, partial [Rhodospirillales bacterium]|nr:hypothetical protein [Rhodospirillales bacterium]
RLLASYGADAFYDCDSPAGIARAVVAAQRATRAANPRGSGGMTCDDLARYRVITRPPLSGRYRGYGILTVPPSSSGGLVLLQMLAMLERFPIGDAAQGFGFGGFATLNVMQEAMRLAYADRANGWVIRISCLFRRQSFLSETILRTGRQAVPIRPASKGDSVSVSASGWPGSARPRTRKAPAPPISPSSIVRATSSPGPGRLKPDGGPD